MALEAIGLSAILDDRNFQSGLKRYSTGIGQMTSLTDGAAKMLSGAFVAATGVAVAGIGALVAASKMGLDATLAWAENMDKLGDQFGMTGEQASAWTVAMNHVGLSVEEGAAGLNYFTRNLDDMSKAVPETTTKITDNSKAIAGLKEQLGTASERLRRAKERLAEAKKPTDAMRYAVADAQKEVDKLNKKLAETPASISKVTTSAPKLTPFGEALKKLGVSAYDAKGKMKTFDDIMPEIMDKFQKLPVGVNASALAMDLFGARGGTKFLDFLRQGGKGLKDATAMAKALGLELSTDEVNAAEEFGFAMNDLNMGLMGVKNTIGRAVLPIAKQLVEWINSNVIPRLIDLAQKYVPQLKQGAKLLGDELGRLWQAFQSNGVSGVIGQIVKDVQGAWPQISAQLSIWGSQFWNWLTRDVVPTVGANIFLLSNSINTALQQNWPTISAALDKWKAQFWDWVTARGGLIDSAATTMAKLTASIRDWTKDPKTQKELSDFGSGIATAILDSISNLFSDQKKADGVLENLVKSLNQARIDLGESFANVGGGIGSGIADGFFKWITGKEMIESARQALSGWMSAAVQAFVLGDTSRLVQMIVDGILGKYNAPAPAPAGPAGGTYGPAYDVGGWVRRTGPALVHRGEYIIPARQVQNITNLTNIGGGMARTLNFNFGAVYGVSDFDYRVRQLIDAHDRGH